MLNKTIFSILIILIGLAPNLFSVEQNFEYRRLNSDGRVLPYDAEEIIVRIDGKEDILIPVKNVEFNHELIKRLNEILKGDSNSCPKCSNLGTAVSPSAFYKGDGKFVIPVYSRQISEKAMMRLHKIIANESNDYRCSKPYNNEKSNHRELKNY